MLRLLSLSFVRAMIVVCSPPMLTSMSTPLQAVWRILIGSWSFGARLGSLVKEPSIWYVPFQFVQSTPPLCISARERPASAARAAAAASATPPHRVMRMSSSSSSQDLFGGSGDVVHVPFTVFL